MTSEAFQAGLKRLSVLPGPKMTQERVDIYFDTLRDLSDSEWHTAVEQALRSSEFFPVPATLRRFAGIDSEGPMLAEAQDYLTRVLEGLGSSYNPRIGTTWNLREIIAKTNRAFGEAVGAGGGVDALAGCDPEVGVPIRNRKIIETYARISRESPSLRLPPGGVKGELTQGEATQAVDLIKRITGKQDPSWMPPDRNEDASIAIMLLKEKASDAPPKAPKPKPSMTQAEWDARCEALRRQRDEMLIERAPRGGD